MAVVTASAPFLAFSPGPGVLRRSLSFLDRTTRWRAEASSTVFFSPLINFGCQVLNLIPPLKFPFLGPSLVFMILYVWSREVPDARVSILGLVTLKAVHLPWAMLALNVIFGHSLKPDILGILAGHLYYFLEVLHPLAGGKYILKTSIWVDSTSVASILLCNKVPEAEKVVGWARNHYLSCCSLPYIKGDTLVVPRESLEVVVSRLREQETTSKKPSQTLKGMNWQCTAALCHTLWGRTMLLFCLYL